MTVEEKQSGKGNWKQRNREWDGIPKFPYEVQLCVGVGWAWREGQLEEEEEETCMDALSLQRSRCARVAGASQ